MRETLSLVLSGDQPEAALERLLQKWSSQFVSKEHLQVLLRELELGILKNVTHHLAVTKQTPAPETVVSAARGAGITGITEAVSARWEAPGKATPTVQRGSRYVLTSGSEEGPWPVVTMGKCLAPGVRRRPVSAAFVTGCDSGCFVLSE